MGMVSEHRTSSLRIIASPSGVEYRVYNGSDIFKGRWRWTDLFIVLLVGCWIRYDTLLLREKLRTFALIALIIIYIYKKCQTVLYESITALPGLGIQQSTTSGLPLPYYKSRLLRFTSHTFIPSCEITTIVINQGLRRFKVEYYLAIVLRNGNVVVVYKESRPHLNILLNVYYGTRATMFEEVKMGDE